MAPVIRWAGKRLARFGVELELPDSDDNVSIRDTSYPAQVVKIKRHSTLAVTLHLRLLEGYRLHYSAGQFVRVAVQIGPNIFRRCYSLSSTPSEPDLAITVKRVFLGRVSNFLNDHVRVGDVLYVDDPSGEFILPEKTAADQRYVFVAAGSGIVPVFSLIRDLLERNPEADIQLVYSNRDQHQALFRKELEKLSRNHVGFRCQWVFTRQHDLPGGGGRLSADDLWNNLDDPDTALFYICGPAGMARACMSMLKTQGIPETRIKVELFSSSPAVADNMELKPRVVSFSRKGSWLPPVHVRQRKVETLLETAQRANVKIASDCRSGSCKTCKVKLKRGRVLMDEPNALTLQEARDGYVLACIAYPCQSVEVQLPPRGF